jgi:polyhydroxyalkanoate synthesis regulator phasin
MAWLQKGFHIGLGATTSLLESVQDSDKRTENLSQLRLGVDELAQLWDQKGQKTEQEARTFVDTLFPQGSAAAPAPAAASTGDQSRTQTQTELEELTQQLAEIRSELEQNQ